jgi:hypothetical protein
MRTEEELIRAKEHLLEIIDEATKKPGAFMAIATVPPMLSLVEWALGDDNSFGKLLDELDKVDAKKAAV